ncbi:hypothetical protein ACWGOQ_0005510 [Aquimarina sp. M1]
MLEIVSIASLTEFFFHQLITYSKRISTINPGIAKLNAIAYVSIGTLFKKTNLYGKYDLMVLKSNKSYIKSILLGRQISFRLSHKKNKIKDTIFFILKAYICSLKKGRIWYSPKNTLLNS